MIYWLTSAEVGDVRPSQMMVDGYGLQHRLSEREEDYWL